jgi:Skp family chaperone for outer membrane proteins
MLCGKCEQVVNTGDAEFCICPVCEKRFHPNKSCAGATKTVKKSWKCGKCIKAGSNTSTPTGENAPFSFGEAFTEFKEEIRGNFKAFQEELEKIRQEFAQEVITLKSTVEVLKKQSDERELTIDSLLRQVNAQEQYSRNRNIELANVEQLESENIEQIILNIAEKLNIELDARDIDAVHRLPTKVKKGSDKIIVQFTTRKTRDSFLEKRKEFIKSSDITSGQRDLRVYINENLSPFNRELLWKTKLKAKDKDIKFVWVKNGRILAKKDEGSNRVYRIESFKDLEIFDSAV